MQNKLHIRKGDMVQVLSGKDRGEQGRVLTVYPKQRRAIVEGINLVHRHQRPNARQTQGGIVEVEAPIHVSNLALLDPVDGRPVRIGRRRDDSGRLVRYSKRSEKEIK